jgi:hypothetical protein
MPRSPCPDGQVRNRTTKQCRARLRPGRKPTSTRSNCPDGQVRNRTTKQCRARLRAGRKTARKVDLSKKIKSIKFYVELKGPDYVAFPAEWNGMTLQQMMIADTKRVRATVHAPKVAKKVIQWYKKHAHKNLVDIVHLGGSQYEITYTGVPSLTALYDPDDDGNYPLIVDRKEHLVVPHANY